MKGYEYIANLIKDYGITHYFYQEGVMRYTYKELDKMGIRGILAHSENAAGYMADGYARAAGDAHTVVGQLVPAVSTASRKEWHAHCRELFAETMAEYDNYKKSDKSPINPGRMCYEIGRALPDDAVLVGDTGYSAVWSADFIKMKDTQTYFRAAGSLGWAYPASLGIKCALPDRPVFCFAGDGAMFYHLCEIETACRYGINTITLINNNNILAQSAYGIKRIFDGDLPKAEHHYKFTNPNFARLAEDFGAVGIRIEDPSEIGAAIKKAMTINKPVIIEVLTDPEVFIPDYI